MDTHEPWYQKETMNKNEAKKSIFNVLKHKYSNNHELLNKVINEIIHDKVEMGSIRGYYTFQHNEFKLKVQERIEYIQKK